jgi:capsid portal protein
MAEDSLQFDVFEVPRPQLYDRDNVRLLKAALLDPAVASNQEELSGDKVHPVDFPTLDKLLTSSTYHETCIDAKKKCTVGLGFRNEYDKKMLAWKRNPSAALPDGDQDEQGKAYQALEPLVDGSPIELLLETAESFYVKGNAYWEVVRDDAGSISSIWPIAPERIRLRVEDKNPLNRHWRMRGDGTAERIFARFGDKDNLIARLPEAKATITDPKKISEVIHFKMPGARSRWYGFPDYISAVPAIELQQMVKQQQYDFFNNRGVPEFMLFFLGQQLPKDVWAKVQEAMKANIGLGNQHKSMAFNISDPNMKVQLEKLAVEGKTENSYQELNYVLAQEIISAHRVPTLLAGLQVPAKIAATNELPNSLLAFQTLYIDQNQQVISETLATTIGKELGLTYQDLLFRKVTDRFDLDKLDTMARMQDEVASPEGKSRDLSAGVKKEATIEDIGAALARIYTAVEKARKQ